MRVVVDISPYWPKTAEGKPRSVNSVYQEIKNRSDRVPRNTLSLAFQGRLDRGKLINFYNLASLASFWSGEVVMLEDLRKNVEDGDR